MQWLLVKSSVKDVQCVKCQTLLTLLLLQHLSYLTTFCMILGTHRLLVSALFVLKVKADVLLIVYA